VLARAQQDAVCDCVLAHNKLRSRLREYYPYFLAVFDRRRIPGVLRAHFQVAPTQRRIRVLLPV
jgi:hypothetical protein